MKEKYEQHTAEKQKVRALKNESKEAAKVDKTKAVLIFDLQQVIYLPRTNESAVFYMRRLSVFNFTVYDITTKECFCYTWDETIAKRGACEIASCLKKLLQEYDNKGFETIEFYSDGCAGQNKNSIEAAMFIHFLKTSTKIKCIHLNFFATNHGQSEGDSAHSAIGYAISHAGDLFVPSQLTPIIHLARRKQPYKVVLMEMRDFFNFKNLAKEIRILTVRKDNESTDPVAWPAMVQWRFLKDHPQTMYFKTSHLHTSYRSLPLPSRRIL